MNPVSFIETKRDGGENNTDQIIEFVKMTQEGKISDYQVAAWLMAVYFKGMSEEENRSFTRALAYSGNEVRFPEGIVSVDKHSTGGVGDKTTLAVVPLAASCGLSVAKLSGRGLGFTGGTIDKLESIPGFRSRLDLESFKRQVLEIGCAVSGHSKDLAPAEAFFYELRDVTGTLPSIPLITSSIVSKKIAGGSKAFVFDVKCGSGAFMKDLSSARELASRLVSLSCSLGRVSMALITGMSQPLGKWVGNSAEVVEAIEVLRGKGPSDTSSLSIMLTGSMLFLGGKAESIPEGEKIAKGAMDSGQGMEMFERMVLSQGGRLDEFLSMAERGDHISPFAHSIKADQNGWVNRCDAGAIGEAVRFLGGGRSAKEDEIDRSICCEVLCKIGDKVEKGQVLAKIFCRKEDDRVERAVETIEGAFALGEMVEPAEILLGIEGPMFPD